MSKTAFVVTTETLEYNDEYYSSTDGWETPVGIYPTRELAEQGALQMGVLIVRGVDAYMFSRYEQWADFTPGDLNDACQKALGRSLWAIADVEEPDDDDELDQEDVIEKLFRYATSLADGQIAALLAEAPYLNPYRILEIDLFDTPENPIVPVYTPPPPEHRPEILITAAGELF